MNGLRMQQSVKLPGFSLELMEGDKCSGGLALYRVSLS